MRVFHRIIRCLAQREVPRGGSWRHLRPELGGIVGYWKRHPRKDLERVLEEFHLRGWRIENPPKYYKVMCPCGSHYRWIHLTPSSPYYGGHALTWAKRVCPLWEGDSE